MAINSSNEAKTRVVGIRIKNKEVVPIENTKLKVLLEITGDGMSSNSLGVDIVAVLDVTKMGRKDVQLKKIDAMRRAMNFLIHKLTPNDCLSIVTFSGATANRDLPLSNMTGDCKREIDELLANRLLVVNGSEEGTGLKSANVVIDGLQTALQVLDMRTITASRVSAIMLVMGTCEPQPETANAIQPIQIPESNVPVYTFGLGPLYNEEVLYDIAAKSRGGTFSIADVEETLKFNNLTTAFSRCLAGLQTVVAQDVMLTITSTDKCEIDKVSARGYSKPTDNSLNSVTVSFGNLHYQDNRKVLVDLLLPAVQRAEVVNILEISYSYNSSNGVVVDTERTPLFATVSRANITQVQEKEEVAIEEARLTTVAAMGEAISMANSGKFDAALDQIVKTQIMLEDFVNQPNGSIVDGLRHELFDLLTLLQTDKIYLSHGRAFGRAAQTCHDQQGANVVSYNKKETKPDPFVTLLYHLERAIMFLEIMQKKVDTFRQVSV